VSGSDSRGGLAGGPTSRKRAQNAIFDLTFRQNESAFIPVDFTLHALALLVLPS